MSERRSGRPDHRVARARALRRDMTDAEKKLWLRLRAEPFQSYHFRRQATIGPFFADFASHSHRLVVEVDENALDHSRTAYLTSLGYQVLRFWNHDVLANTEGVLSTISRALNIADSPPPPTPPRRKRGEGSKNKIAL
jgi:very-short-patch-repair endonuclease